ncbi:cadherin-like domain-containing protein [Rhizobium rhizosphaerae]|nr:Ig-like domain-containing protein [Xaviernesmea rhizosphaerae]
MFTTATIPGSGYGSPYLDSLIQGSCWVGPVTYTFGQTEGQSWSANEIKAFETAFSQFESVCGLDFVAVSDGPAMLTEYEATSSTWNDTSNVTTLADHYYPWAYGSEGRYNTENASWWNLTVGGMGFSTIVHELSHAVGLSHPHDGAQTFPGVEYGNAFRDYGDYAMNQQIWTNMSYNPGWTVEELGIELDYGYASGLMALDIAALQKIYGVNTSTRTNADVYQLPQYNAAGTGWVCIWDAGGEDTIGNAGSTKNSVIDLRDADLVGPYAGGHVSWISGVSGGYTIANGVVIENAVGGVGSDKIYGNEQDNRLDGDAGNDEIHAGEGNDILIGGRGSNVLDGGDGQDRAIFAGLESYYMISGEAGGEQVVTNLATGETDYLSSIEIIQFGTQTFLNAPIADTDGPYAGVEDVTLVVNAANGVLAGDSDVDGDPLVAQLVTGPDHGTLMLNADGSFVYTPVANYNGRDSFVYQAFDGTLVSAPITVSLNVDAGNDAPVADDDGPYAAVENVALTVDAAKGVLAGDGDVDGDPLVAQLLTGPEHGTLMLYEDGSFIYTPVANYNGSDSFTYYAFDGARGSNAVEVSLNVGAVNGAPVARDDVGLKIAPGWKTYKIAAATLLYNDEDGDPETQQSLSIVAVGNAKNGKVELKGGDVYFTPKKGYVGPASFTYTLYDGEGGTATATAKLAMADKKGGYVLVGTQGDDDLFGGLANDKLDGKGGDDWLSGDLGQDVLTGGGGTDYFAFVTKLDAKKNVDTITDFKSGLDWIVLDKTIFKTLSKGVLSDAAFAANSKGAAKDASDRIVYNTKTGDLFYDADGSGKGGAVLFAKIAGHGTVNADDFFVL